MSRKLYREDLEAELSAVRQLLDSVPKNDPAGRVAFQSRLDQLVREIAVLDKSPDTSAAVALVFNEGPVYGSHAIDAEFAGKALEAYQDLVATKVAASTWGRLGRRGPLPGREASRLLVTDVVRGSFGFLLREAHDDEPGFFPSPVRESVGAVSAMLSSVAHSADDQFAAGLEDIDARVFQSLRRFVETLHDSSASLRLVDGPQDQGFDRAAIHRAYERVTHTFIDEAEDDRRIMMIGIIPVGRRFEANDLQTGQFITGKVGPAFSQGYLERANRGEVEVSGRQWNARILRRTARRSDGREIETLVLLDLQPIEKQSDSEQAD